MSETQCAPKEDDVSATGAQLTEAEVTVLNVLRMRAPLSLNRRKPKGRSNGDARRQTTFREATLDNDLQLYPGDVCVLLRPESDVEQDQVCLFVSTLVGHAKGRRA